MNCAPTAAWAARPNRARPATATGAGPTATRVRAIPPHHCGHGLTTRVQSAAQRTAWRRMIGACSPSAPAMGRARSPKAATSRLASAEPVGCRARPTTASLVPHPPPLISTPTATRHTTHMACVALTLVCCAAACAAEAGQAECSGHGACSTEVANPTCLCDAFFYGNSCSICTSTALRQLRRHAPNRTRTHTHTRTRTHTHTRTVEPSCPGSPYDCTDSEHGTCVNGTCQCGDKWRGADCSVVRCPGVVENCNGRGTCNSSVEPAQCRCDKHWTGPDCGTRTQHHSTIAHAPHTHTHFAHFASRTRCTFHSIGSRPTPTFQRCVCPVARGTERAAATRTRRSACASPSGADRTAPRAKCRAARRTAAP
jgi:hypothetical protein